MSDVTEILRRHLASFGAGRETPVLSAVDSAGWPVSLRCRARQDDDKRFLLGSLPQRLAVSGPGTLLWHRHDENFANTAALSVAGVVDLSTDPAVFMVDRLIAAVNLTPGFSPEVFARMERSAMEYLQAQKLAAPSFSWDDFDDIVSGLAGNAQGRSQP